MIRMEMTARLLGIRVSGGVDEFRDLLEALYQLVPQEVGTEPLPADMLGNRVLGLCYDLRHAARGDHGVVLTEDSIVCDITGEGHESVDLKTAVCYFEVLYPELCYQLMGIEYLIERRCLELTRKHYRDPYALKGAWDMVTTLSRQPQAAFLRCMGEALPAARFAGLVDAMEHGWRNLSGMYVQYLDHLNLEFLRMRPEQREGQFDRIIQRMTGYAAQDDYQEMARTLEADATRYRAAVNDLELDEEDRYPEEYDW